MKSYVWLTFGFMGWAYYEISGGSGFEPVLTAVVVETPAPEIVARADTPTLQSLSTSNITQLATAYEANLTVVPEAIMPVAVTAAPEPEPVDIRAVQGRRVNMRMGPGTRFDVVTTLDAGAELQVFEVNDQGWASVATTDRGIQGWIAARLLSEPAI